MYLILSAHKLDMRSTRWAIHSKIRRIVTSFSKTSEPHGEFRRRARSDRAVVARDWLKLIHLGANSYILMKIGATIGIGHYHQGAQERGETYEEFLATRNVPEAR